MDKLRLDTLAVRVVEWHNRHPLARRIGVQHVLSLGYVALPCAGRGPAEPIEPVLVEDPPPGLSLRARAQARARQGGSGPVAGPALRRTGAAPTAVACEPAFSEDFLAPITPRRVARWALRHARELVVAPRDGPVRRIAAASPGATRTLYAMTALIETAGLRSRVLVGAGDAPSVLGRRLWNPPRVAAATAAACMVVGTGLVLQALAGAPAVVPLASASVPLASAATAGAAGVVAAAGLVHPVSPVVPAPLVPTAAALGGAGPALVDPHAGAGHPAPAWPDAAADAASAPRQLQRPPVDVEPRLGKVDLPSLNLPYPEAPRPARRLAWQVPAPAPVAPGPAPPTAVVPIPVPAVAPSSAVPPVAAVAPPRARPDRVDRTEAAVAAAAAAPSFAVSTRLLRTRTESEQVMVAMQALLATIGMRDLRVEIVPAGDDWRVVSWPFSRRDEADRARALLVSRGMRVAVVDF